MALIPCQNCKQQYTDTYTWYICNTCGYRICPTCIGAHKGTYSNGGFKCSQCPMGNLQIKR